MGDLLLAVRSLLKSKLFTAVAVGTLAIGIGASTAVFSLFNAVALRPLPFPNQERLVDIEEWSASELCGGCSVGVSLPTLKDFAPRVQSLQSIASYLERPANIAGASGPERVGSALISGSFFSVLGLNAAIGRAIDPSDDRVDAPPVVVLSGRLFTRLFGDDRSVIGQQIRLNGTPHTIIGVMPPTAILPEMASLWIAMAPSYHVADRSARELGVIGRLRDGVSVATADNEVKTLAAGVASEHPDTQKGWTTRVRSLRRALAGDKAVIFGIMLGAVLVLLLIVCANLAGLMLARGVARRKDLAVRIALGAKRSAIVWHLLAESLCLSIAGGVIGLVAASWAVDAMLAALGTQIPSWLEPQMDFRVIGFALVISIVSAAAFGLIPALRSSRDDVHDDIKAGGPATVGRSRGGLRGSLIVLQLAASLVLLTAAGVLAVSTQRISARETGVSDGNLLQARIEMLGTTAPDQQIAKVKSLVGRLSTMPGARTAAATATHFVAGFGGRDQSIRAEGVPAVPEGASPRFYFAVTPKYFDAMGLRLLRGRGITEGDVRGSTPIVVVNQEMSRRLWPNADPIGRRIRLGAADSLPWLTIVGVVSDIGNPASGRISNYAYVPFSQAPQAEVRILVRATADPAALIKPVREAARSIDPDLPLLDLMTVEQDRARTVWPYRSYALMMTAVGFIALVLAGIGLYGIVAFAVEQRTREMGLRIALGAKRLDVITLIGRQGLVLVAIGVVFGVAGGLVVLPVLKSVLFGASPINPYVFAAAAAVLVAVALVASYIPARRATHVDPMVAMKSE